MIQNFKEIAPAIHDTAWVHPDATVIGDVDLGPGVSVWPRSVLRGDMGRIEIGEDTNFQDGAIAHDTGIQLSRMPFNLGNDTAFPSP